MTLAKPKCLTRNLLWASRLDSDESRVMDTIEVSTIRQRPLFSFSNFQDFY